jgi:hypothetical protein
MKAFMVYCGNIWDGCLLVYAKTRNQARYIATSFDPFFLSEYEYNTAVRKPGWDKYYDGRSIIDCNMSLPDGAPAFYTEETATLEPLEMVKFR